MRKLKKMENLDAAGILRRVLRGDYSITPQRPIRGMPGCYISCPFEASVKLTPEQILVDRDVIEALSVAIEALDKPEVIEEPVKIVRTVVKNEYRRFEERVVETVKTVAKPNYFKPEDDKRLKQEFYLGYSVADLAASHERSEESVMKRLKHLKLVPENHTGSIRPFQEPLPPYSPFK